MGPGFSNGHCLRGRGELVASLNAVSLHNPNHSLYVCILYLLLKS